MISISICTHPRITPGPGQESVWDYPRPPRLESTARRIRVVFGGVTIVDSTRAQRVLETSHPPTYYVPLDDIVREHLEPVAGSTYLRVERRRELFRCRRRRAPCAPRGVDLSAAVATVRRNS